MRFKYKEGQLGIGKTVTKKQLAPQTPISTVLYLMVIVLERNGDDGFLLPPLLPQRNGLLVIVP